jgi:predicted RNA-binding protein (virulence factor B family)
MLNVGRFNELIAIKELPRGLQLDGGSHGEILLPKQYVKEYMKVGDALNVFIYRDSEGRLIATTKTPYAQVGDFAHLNVVDESPVGMFLDWGLPKDILVPFSEQNHRLEKGKQALVRIYLDDAERLVASAKIDSFLHDTDENDHYKNGDEVNIIIAGKSDLGVKVIVDGAYWGLVYHSDVFENLLRGDKKKAYVQRVREDKKLEISLKAPGFARVEGLALEVLEKLQAEDGFLPISDKSDPKKIKDVFKCSKNSFKQAIGVLYKARIITIEKTGITLIAED